MRNGYRWITGVFDHGLRLVAVAGALGTPLVILTIHHGHHLWLLGISAGAVVLLALGEGAYQTWAEADSATLGDPAGRDDKLLRKRLLTQRSEGEAIRETLRRITKKDIPGNMLDLEWRVVQGREAAWSAKVMELLASRSQHLVDHFAHEPKSPIEAVLDLIDPSEERSFELAFVAKLKRFNEVIEWLA
jgi:hypothetical protein